MADPSFWNPLDTLTLADLETLQTGLKREKSTLDFKRFGAPPDKLVDAEAIGRDICAFANAMGGRIVLGAIDDGADGVERFAGIEMKDLKSVRSSIRNATHAVQPPPLVEPHEVALQDGRVVVVLEIRPGIGGPHQHKGTYLLRSVDGTTPLPHSTVVLSVLATHGRARDEWGAVESINGVGAGLVLSPWPFGEGGRGFYVGVELRPAYPLPRPLCDPLGPAADAVLEYCRQEGYTAKKERTGIRAQKVTGDRQEKRRLLFSGLVDAVELLGERAHVSRFRLAGIVEWQIRRLAKLLFEWNQPLLVDARVGVWATGGSDMQLILTRDDAADSVALGCVPPSLTFREDLAAARPLVDLMDKSVSNELALRACGLLELHLQPCP
jgi:hypothetical protein